MTLKYFIISLFTLWLVTASDSHFGIELTWEKTPKPDSDDVRELPWMSTDSFRSYLEDYDDRISDLFPVTNYYYPTVNFWFMIYTQFESSQVVIHDKSNLNLIYKVLDFSPLYKKNLSKNILYVLQEKLSEERIRKLKALLKDLAHDPFSLKQEAKILYRTLQNAGVKLPVKKIDRQAFFNRLRDNVRTQTGQKDFIRAGIIRSLPYKKFLNSYFSARKLPPELLAIPFLESSFNPKAESKVGALGVWQFMPLIASYYVPKRSLRPEFDYRSNVGVISVAAANLFEENFKLMKSWDLTVTAYNSGTKHLLKTRRELASSMNTINLEAVIKNSDSQFFGFASKNFYSEFLALIHTLAYEEELFDNIHTSDRYNVEEDLGFYLLKCTLKLDKLLTEKQKDDVIYHNHHLENLNLSYQKGTIITAKENLPSSKFYKLSLDQMVKYKPKDWDRFLKNQSCSTK